MKMSRRILEPGRPTNHLWSTLPCSYCGVPGVVCRFEMNGAKVSLCQVDLWLLETDPKFLDDLEVKLFGHADHDYE